MNLIKNRGDNQRRLQRAGNAKAVEQGGKKGAVQKGRQRRRNTGRASLH